LEHKEDGKILLTLHLHLKALFRMASTRDDCWRSDPKWAYNRQALARCGVGFGTNAMGGASGPIYVVTGDTDTDLVNPAPGTLLNGIFQDVS
jgi:hypothetical protein